MTLRFAVPHTLEPKTQTKVRIFQRNDQRVITGSVLLEVQTI